MSNLVHSLGAKAGAFYSQITESVELDPQTQGMPVSDTGSGR